MYAKFISECWMNSVTLQFGSKLYLSITCIFCVIFFCSWYSCLGWRSSCFCSSYGKSLHCRIAWGWEKVMPIFWNKWRKKSISPLLTSQLFGDWVFGWGQYRISSHGHQWPGSRQLLHISGMLILQGHLFFSFWALSFPVYCCLVYQLLPNSLRALFLFHFPVRPLLDFTIFPLVLKAYNFSLVMPGNAHAWPL